MASIIPSNCMEDLAAGRLEAIVKLRQPPYRRSDLHAHPHFELLYIMAGVRECELNGCRYTANPGDLLIFRPGDLHVEFAGTATVSYFVFRFRPGELAAAQVEFPTVDRTGPVLPLPHKEEFMALFNRMMAEWRQPGEDSSTLLGAYLVEFVIHLRRAVNEVLQQPPGDDGDTLQLRVRSAMDLIQSNVDGDVDLKELARHAFMSVSHFSRTFKETVGESPKHYLIRERIERAKELLATTDHKVQAIAEQLGYANVYFFYRQFRQKTGMTTSAYRRLHGKKVHAD